MIRVATQKTAVRASVAALALVLAGLTWLEFRNISTTLPYPQVTDEVRISASAQRMLTTGSLHPDSFNYPSLPTYLTAVAMAAGFVQASTHLEILDLNGLGNAGFPYYETRRPIETARRTFALMSIVALAMTALCAWLVTGRPSAILIAPALAAATPLFFFESWAYLNVDMLGTCFVAMTIAACLVATRHPSVRRSALIPAVLAGLAVGSKYTLALVILPVLLGIWLHANRPIRVRATIVALAAMAATFLMVAPYSVLDVPGFLGGLAFEGYHYANGHPGAEGEPGWSQLVYYASQFEGDFGSPAATLALVGIAVYSLRAPRQSAILLSFPLVSLYVLTQQRVHFSRNVLSMYPVVAVYAAEGLLAVHAWSVALARRFGLPPRRLTSTAIALVLLILALPMSHLRDLFRDRTDSRNIAVAWLAKAIAPSWTIVVPEELGIDLRAIRGSPRKAVLGPYGARNRAQAAQSTGHKVVVVNLASARTESAADALLASVEAPAVILVPEWGADPWWPGARRAEELEAVARRWHPVERFGTEPVIANHENGAPWGNPAFGVAPLNLPDEWIEWLENFDATFERPD